MVKLAIGSSVEFRFIMSINSAFINLKVVNEIYRMRLQVVNEIYQYW